ncbi:MAG: Crp/Fnr family transcriptional regulator [Firmicutes bacterium]|nr:Crp/Fnr family transcriptional regulator [Bacillota bacterium]
MSRCMLCLHDLPIFDSLPREDFKDICLNATKKTLKKGDYLFYQGQLADTLYLIKDGAVKLVQFTEQGKELIIDVVGRGQVVGETALFKQQQNLCDAVALETVHVCSFSLAQFEALIEIRPQIALQIISNLGHKLYISMQRLGDATNHSVESKVLALLFRLAQEHGHETLNGHIIELTLTQEDIANMIGASRVMVAQVLKQFSQDGIIAKQGKYYLILDKCLKTNFGEKESLDQA